MKSLRRCHDHKSRIRSKEFLGLNSQFRYLANAAGSDGDSCLKERQDRIRVETRLVSTQMVPEIKLHLITPDMEVWQSPFSWPNRGPGHIFSEGDGPYWAVFWPGGQALVRHILNFPNLVRGKRILDLGCGCGAASIAALLAGANSCLANDIDINSLAATDLNASVCFESSTQQVSSAEPKIKTEALKDRLQYSSENLLEGDVESRGERLRDSFDVMIVGDLFYDQDIGDAICRLTAAFQSSNESDPNNQRLVLIGDPGRWYLSQNKSRFKCLAKYELTDEIKEHNYGFTTATILCQ